MSNPAYSKPILFDGQAIEQIIFMWAGVDGLTIRQAGRIDSCWEESMEVGPEDKTQI